MTSTFLGSSTTDVRLPVLLTEERSEDLEEPIMTFFKSFGSWFFLARLRAKNVQVLGSRAPKSECSLKSTNVDSPCESSLHLLRASCEARSWFCSTSAALQRKHFKIPKNIL